MKILSFLNVSNAQRLNCDSGFIFQRILADYLVAKGHEFTLVGPRSLDIPETRHVFYEFGSDKYAVRFNFDWQKLRELILEEKPDLLFVNQAELAANFKSLVVSAGLQIPVVTYLHYMPFHCDPSGEVVIDPSLNNGGLWKSIVLNFLSGVLSSDLIFVHSRYALDLLASALKAHSLEVPLDRFTVLPPPLDPTLIGDRASVSNGRRVIYNHRLYRHYGTEAAIEVLQSLVQNLGCDVEIMDILGGRSQTRHNLDPVVDEFRKALHKMPKTIVRTDGDIRERYRAALIKSKICLGPARPGGVWSMASVDCMSVGVPVMAPRLACFPELLTDDLLFSSPAEALSVARKLVNDSGFWTEKSEQVTQKALELSPAIIGARFELELRKVL